MKKVMKLSESAVGYSRKGLRKIKDEELEQCCNVLHMDGMPCVYTDEEFRQILTDAEREGNASDEDVRGFFAKWGI